MHRALARIQYRPSQTWLACFMVHSEQALCGASGPEVGIIIHSLARLRAEPGQVWMEAFYEHSVRLLDGLGSQSLSNIIYALAKLEQVRAVYS